MPPRRHLGLAAAMALAVLLAGAAAPAQTAAPPVIIIVDVQQILRDSVVARNIQSQMSQRTERYTKEVTQQEDELRGVQDQLEKQRNVLAPDAFNVKMRDFQQRYDALDHGVQVTRQALQQAYNDAMTKVENTALQIIADIAAEKKANLVVTKAAVVFEAPGLDITQEVIRRLNVKLPLVTLAVPAEPNLAAPPPAPVPGASGLPRLGPIPAPH
ncbi:MAG: OmpH family outer membrane protein [Stellaceae bacterium]